MEHGASDFLKVSPLCEPISLRPVSLSILSHQSSPQASSLEMVPYQVTCQRIGAGKADEQEGKTGVRVGSQDLVGLRLRMCTHSEQQQEPTVTNV